MDEIMNAQHTRSESGPFPPFGLGAEEALEYRKRFRGMIGVASKEGEVESGGTWLFCAVTLYLPLQMKAVSVLPSRVRCRATSSSCSAPLTGRARRRRGAPEDHRHDWSVRSVPARLAQCP